MTDREKLIELLEDAHREFYKKFDPNGDYFGTMADHLVANGVTFAKDTDGPGKWISVEDKLPNGWVMIDPCTDYREPETYMVFVKGAMFPTTAFFLDGEFIPACEGFLQRKNCDCTGFADEITHWMPLPKPPKEG